MNVYPALKPNKPCLVKWFIKHGVSSKVTSKDFAIRRAIEHLQLKHELKLLREDEGNKENE